MESPRRKQAAAADREPHVQIRSRERVRGLAEVYTHEREVSAMLDLVPDMFPSASDPGNTDRTFLEPACGHGNFLVEILRRKLEYVTPRRYGRGERFEHRVLRCLSSIYGIDICEDNVHESRERMEQVVYAHLEEHLGITGPTVDLRAAVEAILGTNVVCADSLAGAAIELVEYRAGSWGTFTRRWFLLDRITNESSLLSCRRDEAPVHYSELSDTPDPVACEIIEREAA
jgi:hypothetical protein